MSHPINIDTWPRREHYHHFRGYAQPFFTVTVRVPVDAVYARARARGGALFGEMLYDLTRAAQEEPAFRLRLRPEGVVEHEQIHPSFTARGPQGTFRFLITPWHPERERFLELLSAELADWSQVQAPMLDVPERDDLIWVSCLPGLDFTGFQPSLRGAPLDSVPILHWGRVVTAGDRREVGLAVSVNHALVDGAQVTQFVERLTSAWGG